MLVANVTPVLAERSIAGLHASLIEHLPGLRPARAILDLGCGSGAWLARLAGNGFTNLTGVDQDVAQFGDVPAKVIQLNLDSQTDGVNTIGQFDLITAIEVVEHVESPAALLRFVERHLTSTGKLLLTTPNTESTIARLRFLLTGHLKQFDRKGDTTHITPVFSYPFERIVARCRMRVISSWTFPENTSPTSAPPIRIAAGAVRRFLPKAPEGDIVCRLLERDSAT